ncbi:MAG: hypothetical protein HN416_11525 [Nitrospina sp.]|nr:hypothetical protein [Nitrospina sp.]MBT7081921.1 hypothetical protein [Chloroflexota bacterium]
MEIRIQQHQGDMDQIEMYSGPWLMGTAHGEHFDKPILDRLEDGEVITMELVEKGVEEC